MPFHFDFSAAQILWIFTFAAELVLLIVLLGRDRARRFLLFTASIALGVLILLVTRLLFGRMAAVTTSTIFLALSDIDAFIGLLVVVEVARRAFTGIARRAWLTGAAIIFALAIATLIFWGPWPNRTAFTGGSLLVTLRSMQVISDKGATLAGLLDIELAVVIIAFGRRFNAGWRSHPQQIAIGLSTAALSQFAVRLIWQRIATHTTIHSQADYQHALTLRDRIYNANNVVYLLVLVWWIAWLWLDEPGTESRQPGSEPSKAPEGEGNASEI